MKTEIRNRLNDPAQLVDMLGIGEGSRRRHDGIMVRCPTHGDSDPSCSIRRCDDGTVSIKCFGCPLSGDVFDLIGAVHGIDTNSDFPAVLKIAADMAGVDEDGREYERVERDYTPAPPEYPPADELKQVWVMARRPADDDEVTEYLVRRGITETSDLCRVVAGELPGWAVFRESGDTRGYLDWNDTGHRLIFPLYNHEGRIKSFRARCVKEDSKLKNVNPKRYSSSGLCFANALGVKMLQTGYRTGTVVFVEGEIDFLNACQRADGDTAIFGLYSGGWSSEHSERLNTDRVVFLTDVDGPGDRYAFAVMSMINPDARWIKNGVEVDFRTFNSWHVSLEIEERKRK